MKTWAFGYPKLGEKREYKKLLEGFWAGKITEEEFLKGIEELEKYRLETYKKYVDSVPVGELNLYDFMLDTALMLGVIPERFKGKEGLELYYEMARGKQALEMTKWFNTNYHYLVPEIEKAEFSLRENKPLKAYKEAKEKFGLEGRPTLVGPYTFLKLSKTLQKVGEEGGLPIYHMEKIESAKVLKTLMDKLIPVYKRILQELKAEGVKEVQIDEPAFVLNLNGEEVEIIENAYRTLTEGLEGMDIYLITYYEGIDDRYFERIVNLPVTGIGLDFVSSERNLRNLRSKGFPKSKKLVAGVVPGRNVWRLDLNKTAQLLKELIDIVEEENLIIANAQPLYHLPITVEPEKKLPEGLKERLSFAKERLGEIKLLKGILGGDSRAKAIADEVSKLLGQPFGRNEEVIKRIKNLKEEDFVRKPSYGERDKVQRELLGLPLFPTTTIGSFPQTPDVRKARVKYRKGELSEEEYKKFIQGKIKEAIHLQEELGLDVFVHGEFERSDMVEYFAELLDGIATTSHGWVISYGSRVYRPPIIYGDVSRPKPMTVEWITYAQSLTDKPVKGMLTGPVTILNWSYAREDIPRSEIAYQIALAILDEVLDLERNGINIIQIDEPAFREAVPIKKEEWDDYFNWAIKAFRLSNSKVKPETQIHTHMCYSDFNEIIEQIYEMDFDVISIEASRSKGEIIEAFEKFGKWDRQIGVGVYDIHSPAIPSKEEMKAVMQRVMKVLPKELLWVNPDCGLKTRKWEEVIPALKNMVEVAKELRKEYGNS
ncbi:MAG TPA: 5-methyltetrahydropteroyltriglutamate--homocysteine S-methyltransferase [Aquifex aeolicus]|uniref:5-methyltetrahydropteroyltriglutamate--homocysteine methyltransferase n=1 Tax=Aquifex aeolicus TaxID=63363 RepID=A0A9D0YPM2_AQUAO|nr:5-methyltetrahydropteroyltriglutamate--homocysteine S-methyltransferase [Aquifex aeolicus]